MESVRELIEKIKVRPAAYIGKHYISNLKSFIDGWFYGNPNGIIDSNLMNEFQDWIEDKYKVNTTHSWSNIILFYSADEYSALNNFFELFDEFLEGKSG